ncbi:MAG: ABC transporter ATP-binding protein [Chloroflexi bacterium]|nr:ABC transporter ATP-binding protein [Chloroflexota bacterium]OJV96576.1 MAG: hemin ABC transporter ATP-binding protein [Chloroflexi bacterium 54-19]
MSGLILDKVSKVYGEGDNRVAALNEVSLQVLPGEFVAVVGPSGSGKTTMLAVAGALLHPTSGKISIGGTDLNSLPKAAVTGFRLKHIGFILQSSNLVPYLTALDQLLLIGKLNKAGAKQSEQKARDLLANLDLKNRLDHYPEALSGGERQRVAIARALMSDPDVLLADEPTASLDSHRGQQVVEMLVREVKSRQKAAVMVTHDERMLDFCDRVIRIEDGSLVNI